MRLPPRTPCVPRGGPLYLSPQRKGSPERPRLIGAEKVSLRARSIWTLSAPFLGRVTGRDYLWIWSQQGLRRPQLPRGQGAGGGLRRDETAAPASYLPPEISRLSLHGAQSRRVCEADRPALAGHRDGGGTPGSPSGLLLTPSRRSLASLSPSLLVLRADVLERVLSAKGPSSSDPHRDPPGQVPHSPHLTHEDTEVLREGGTHRRQREDSPRSS